MMARPRKPVPEWAPEGRQLRADGFTWDAIAERLGPHKDTVRYWCCDAYRASKFRRKRKPRKGPIPKEERLRRARESHKRTRVRRRVQIGMGYDKWLEIRRHCRELAAQQNRPVEELYREFGVER